MADLRSRIQHKVDAGLAKLGTVRTACVYQKMLDPVYDPNSGSAVNAIAETASLKITFSDFSQTRTRSTEKQFDDVAIRDIDKLAIFPTLRLQFKPSINDIIVDEELTEWRVVAATGDPAGAHYSLHVRPLKDS